MVPSFRKKLFCKIQILNHTQRNRLGWVEEGGGVLKGRVRRGGRGEEKCGMKGFG